MIVNVNARTVTEGGIYVQFQENGRAKDAVFENWDKFVDWLKNKVQEN